jgi:hypothetical protein
LDHDSLLIVGGRLGRVARIGKIAAPSLYSADGFDVSRGGKLGPDVSAVADRSRALSGVLAAGTASGSRVAVTGTSVAAPQVARWCAEEIYRRRQTTGASIAQNTSQTIVANVKQDAINAHTVSSDEERRLGRMIATAV